jgi:transcriptional regulator with XRE-family HTH domain
LAWYKTPPTHQKGVLVKCSDEVLRVRAELGETQQAFAHRLGVGMATVQRWEYGSARPSGYRHVSALVAAGADLEVLLGETDGVAA